MTIEHDVFFSYHWRDHACVEPVARALRERGLEPFLDRWYLTPGRNWQQKLERQIQTCGSVAVFVGPHGLGRWQQREKQLALDRQVGEKDLPVIPVLLPGADEPGLGFLGLNTWVSLEDGIGDETQLDILAKAVRGEPPGPEARKRLAENRAAVSPYRGLQPFREEDAAFFFGRDAFSDKLVQAVAKRDFVAVVGGSGSGKSSVVRAGLVPELRSQTQEGGTAWDVVTLVPGDRPLHALAAALLAFGDADFEGQAFEKRAKRINDTARDLDSGGLELRDLVAAGLENQPGTDRLLLFVDQWEELYTQCEDPALRRRFIDDLLTATKKGPVTVVVTLRADFYESALGHRDLGDRIEEGQVNIGPMTADELRAVVEEPSRLVGLDLEKGLSERILENAGDEPGKLPWLELLLEELWKNRRANLLHHDAYHEIGGLKGVVTHRAEAVFSRLGAPEQALARRLMVQLVKPGVSKDGDTSKRAPLRNLSEEQRGVARALIDERLLTSSRDEGTGEETIQVAHEALIRDWDRLQIWLSKDRSFLQWRERLSFSLGEWRRAGSDPELLLHGTALADARQWLENRPGDLGDSERAFIEESDQRALGEASRLWTDLVSGVPAAVTSAIDRIPYTELDDYLRRVRQQFEEREEPAARAAAGTALAYLGDPRFSEDALYLPDDGSLGFVEIREGSFTMGDVEIKDAPPCPVSVERFYMARFPVTVAQFRRFRDSAEGVPNHPVTSVSWDDALAYCAWLTARLRDWGGTPDPLSALLRHESWAITLPSEAEWEWAARGDDGRRYPWGKEFESDRANTCETGLVSPFRDRGSGSQARSTVGSFPRGRSFFKIEDLSGNVWEWTRSVDAAYPYDPTDGRESLSAERAVRVLRGGCFRDPASSMRCAFRHRADPSSKRSIFGFRVVASPFGGA